MKLQMSMCRLGAVSAALALVAMGCGKGNDTPATATAAGAVTLSGQVDRATFPYATPEVLAVDWTSKARLTAPVAADGTFSLPLTAGHTWRLYLHPAGAKLAAGQYSTLIRRAPDGSASADVSVKAGRSAIPLGRVAFLGKLAGKGYPDEAASMAFGSKATRGGALETGDGTDTDNVECEDGKTPDGQPCADEGDEAKGEDGKDTDNIECEDGKTPDGQPCADEGADEDDGDPNQDLTGDVAVSENNPDDEGESGDNDEQEGEDRSDDDNRER